METRLRFETTWHDRALETAGWVLLVFLWVMAVVAHRELPDLIPIHFSFAGVITKYGNKITLLFFPATATVMLVGLTLLSLYPGLYLPPGKAAQPRHLLASIRLIQGLKISIPLIFSIVLAFIYLSSFGEADGIKGWIFPLSTAIAGVPVCHYIYHVLRRNNA